MDVILGIDIGGSTTKIVGLRTDGSVISMLRVRAEDQVTSLYGALGNYLTSNRLSLRDVRRVVLTGVGASYVEGDIYGLPIWRRTPLPRTWRPAWSIWCSRPSAP